MNLIKSLLVVAVAIVGLSVMAGAFDAKEYKTYMAKLTSNGKSWATADEATIAEVLKYADSVDSFKSDAERAQILTIYGWSYGYSAKTFADLQKAVEAKLAALKFEAAPNAATKLQAMNAYWRAGNEKSTPEKFQWSKDVYAYMKTVEGYQSWGDAGNYANKVGNYSEAYDLYASAKSCPDRRIQIACENLQDAAKGLEALNDLANGNIRPDQINKVTIIKNALTATSKYLMVSDSVKPEDLKAALGKLNRKYSIKLAADKAKWEPVIAQIRLMLSSL